MKSDFAEKLSDALLHPNGGIIGLVDQLVELCPREGLRLEWEKGQLRGYVPSEGDVPLPPVRQSVFRAMLARVASICNERSPSTVSPYGGEALLTTEGQDDPLMVSFSNTAQEQTLDLARARSGRSTKRVATKRDMMANIADATELSRKQVASVFQALAEQIKSKVGRKGAGPFVVPGLMKITVISKPATKARKGINPFTKEEVIFKAKPARKVLKIRPLKALKDMVK